jgi:hypothetical protein
VKSEPGLRQKKKKTAHEFRKGPVQKGGNNETKIESRLKQNRIYTASDKLRGLKKLTEFGAKSTRGRGLPGGGRWIWGGGAKPAMREFFGLGWVEESVGRSNRVRANQARARIGGGGTTRGEARDGIGGKHARVQLFSVTRDLHHEVLLYTVIRQRQ